MPTWSLGALADVLGTSNVSQVGRMGAEAIVELDHRLAERAAAYRVPRRAQDEYRAVLPAEVSSAGPELQTALAYAHSTAIVDPIDEVFFDGELRPFLAGMTAATLAAGATFAEAQEQLDQQRTALIAGVLSDEEGLRWVRRRLTDAVLFLVEWAPVLKAELLYTVPARAGVAASIMGTDREPVFEPDLFGPGEVLTALEGLPWEIAYEEARGGVMTFNLQLLLARAVGGSPVAVDDVGWRYLRQLVGDVQPDGRAHRILSLASLPGVNGIGPEDALMLHRDVDEFADWHLRLRALGRRLTSVSPDPAQFEEEAREILEEELAPAVRRLRQGSSLAAVRTALPAEGLSMAFGAAGLGGMAALGLPITAGAAVALPIAAASRLAIAALRGPSHHDSPVLARLVQIERRGVRR